MERMAGDEVLGLGGGMWWRICGRMLEWFTDECSYLTILLYTRSDTWYYVVLNLEMSFDVHLEFWKSLSYVRKRAYDFGLDGGILV